MQSPATPPSQLASRFNRARTPPSPTHGPLHQRYEPYSPRRSSRNVGNPYSTQNLGSKPISNHIPPLQTPKRPAFAFTPAELFPSSPPKSPVTTADHSNHSPLKTPHRSNSKKGLGLLDPSSAARNPTAMLPSPSKTPTTTPSRKHNRTASVEHTARILHFQPTDPNDVMPQRSNKYKQKAMRAASTHNLDFDRDDLSDLESTANPSFEVYAESHARVPQLDESEENPFYRPRATTVPQMRSSPRRTRKSAELLAEEQRVDDAAAQDEGLVYMFRGRKILRPYEDPTSESATDARHPANSASQRALRRSVGTTAERPLTRSSLQPRLLFPTAALGSNDIDEEAETDVEMSDTSPEQQRTAKAVSFDAPATPAKPKNGASPMLSPPTTSRTTRKRNAEDVSAPQDDLQETSPAKSAASLPTPERSSKKKKVGINPIPTFEGEPLPVEEESSSALTPQRSSLKKTKSPSPQATEDPPEPPASTGSLSSSSSRSVPSPFDSWPRRKKRDAAPLPNSPKRTRSHVS